MPKAKAKTKKRATKRKAESPVINVKDIPANITAAACFLNDYLAARATVEGAAYDLDATYYAAAMLSGARMIFGVEFDDAWVPMYDEDEPVPGFLTGWLFVTSPNFEDRCVCPHCDRPESYEWDGHGDC